MNVPTKDRQNQMMMIAITAMIIVTALMKIIMLKIMMILTIIK